MTRRSYGQFCGLSKGLDVVGERWTLLIVRELMAGPKRYSDLAEALTGVGTSLLATRLRQLEHSGVIEQRSLPKPSASLVYSLTESGQELAHALLPLALWGVRHQTAHVRGADDVYRAEWSLVFIAQLIEPRTASDDTWTYRFTIDDSTAHLRIRSGEVSVIEGLPAGEEVDTVIIADVSLVVDITSGRLSVLEAVADSRVSITGRQEAAARLIELLPERVTRESAYVLADHSASPPNPTHR